MCRALSWTVTALEMRTFSYLKKFSTKLEFFVVTQMVYTGDKYLSLEH